MEKNDSGQGHTEKDKNRSDFYFDTPILDVLRKYRIGRFFTVEQLDSIDFSQHLNDEQLIRIAEETRLIFVNRVELFGEETIAHLCLQLKHFFALERVLGVFTVGELEERIRVGTLQFDFNPPKRRLHQTYQSDVNEIIRLFEEWKSIDK